MSNVVNFRARWVFPITGPPLRDGVVTLVDGRITRVAPWTAERMRGAAIHDWEDAALIPGLVNAHTHLEFSDLSEPFPAGDDMTDWIRQVIAHRRERDATAADPQVPVEAKRAAIERGIQESIAAGVTRVGEIATAPWPAESWPDAGPDGTVFPEIINLDPERNTEVLADCRNRIEPLNRHVRLRAGLSPHAPYTVNWELVGALCRLSAELSCPLAMHLGETVEELELLASHSGPLVRMLSDVGVWNSGALPRGLELLDYLRMLSTAHRALVIHGNYLTDADIAFLAERRDRMHVVYCPRTHAALGHHDYPLAELHAAGAAFALGTDSRASNPDLCLLSEMRFAFDQHAVAPSVLLEAATRGGAEALGDADAGALETGKAADFTVLEIAAAERADPHELLFDPDVRCLASYRGGLRLA